MPTNRLEFTRKIKERRLAHSGGLCEAGWPETGRCNAQLIPGNREYHHEVEAERNPDNSFENCRAICVKCHKRLTAAFIIAKAKAERQRAVQANSKPAPQHPVKGRGFKEPEPKTAKVSHLAHIPRRSLFAPATPPKGK